MTTYSIQDLRTTLDGCNRLALADLPTPLENMPKLSALLDGPRIIVKREDQTGLAFGGNKVREFEYSVAPAIAEGYDVLLHGAASQSNQSRLTAAVAAKLGLKMVMVGRKDEHSSDMNGNLFLTHLFGADVHLVESAAERAEIVKQLEADGHKVYNTSSDGYYLRSVSYVDGFLELWEQLQEKNVVLDALYVCSGVHTHVGLVVGAKALGVDLRIVGISPSPQDNAKKDAQLAEVANEVCKILDLDIQFTADDFESYGEYAGEDYGVLTPESREAVLLAAQTEGLLLDPVYSGKTFGAMIEHIRKDMYAKDQTVLFVHTGGTPALFAYADELLNEDE